MTHLQSFFVFKHDRLSGDKNSLNQTIKQGMKDGCFLIVVLQIIDKLSTDSNTEAVSNTNRKKLWWHKR